MLPDTYTLDEPQEAAGDRLLHNVSLHLKMRMSSPLIILQEYLINVDLWREPRNG